MLKHKLYESSWGCVELLDVCTGHSWQSTRVQGKQELENNLEVRILQISRQSGDIFNGYKWGPANYVQCGTFTDNAGIYPRSMDREKFL